MYVFLIPMPLVDICTLVGPSPSLWSTIKLSTLWFSSSYSYCHFCRFKLLP